MVVDQRLYGFLDARPESSPVQGLRMLFAHPRTALAFARSRPRVNLAVAVVALFFAGMGIAALVRPAFIWAPFGIEPTTPESRNEVRAVYGGFGLAVAVLLVVADGACRPPRRGAIAVAVSLFGMAAGRVFSGLFEPKALVGFPGFFLLVEAALGGLLLAGR